MSFKGNKQAGTWQVVLRYHRFSKSSEPHLVLCLRGVKHSVYVCVGKQNKKKEDNLFLKLRCRLECGGGNLVQ